MQKLNKILALDVGNKNIGIAITDEEHKLAFPRQSIKGNKKDLLNKITQLIIAEDIKKIVVGFPLGKNGEETTQCKKIKLFAQALKALNIEVIFWDERFTTSEAKNTLLYSNLPTKKHKEKIHNIAASLILQSYLQSLT